MTSPLAGEFLGTMILVLLGDGVVAAVLLKRSKAEGSGWMVITAGWAFAVMAGVFTSIACGSSDAHLNPAVTIGFAVREGNFAKFAPYLAAQMLGAIVGAVLVFVIGAIFSKSVSAAGPAAGLGPYLAGSLVWGIGLSLGGPTGYAINPARDLGPRIVHAILPIAGKGGSDWAYSWIPVVGPIIGGVIGAVVA